MKVKPFRAEQFTAISDYTTAEDKAKFANQLVDFILSGFPETKFTKKFYNQLNGCFGHIAHYNQHGFYGTWFSDTQQQIDFLRNILRHQCYGDPAYTYSDVERAVKSWLAANLNVMESLQQKRDAVVEAHERTALARLKEKYERV